MSVVKHNVIANFIGRVWSAVIGLAFIPLYIKYLGIESYGLIGIFASLSVLFVLLDMGMTPALSREMARFTGNMEHRHSVVNLLRTIEIIFLGVAILIALSVFAMSGWLASSWVNVDELSVKTVALAFSLMGVLSALRFFENIYSSSIIGLQRQVLLNVYLGLLATLRSCGALAVLIFISPTIEAFFIWQVIISIITILLLSKVVYRTLSSSVRAGVFSIEELKKIWKFAGGLLGITLLSILLTQSDKILLSKILTLKNFGIYSLATSVSVMLYMFVTPITQAFYPRFVMFLEKNDLLEISNNYHLSSQLVNVFAGSAAMIIFFHSEFVLGLWTQDLALSSVLAPLVSLLILGNLANALLWIPAQMQLAYKWTSLQIKANIILVIIIVPSIILIVPKSGPIGAAWVWLIINVSCIIVCIPIMHNKILKKDKWKWYLQDLLMPILVAAIFSYCFKIIQPKLVMLILNIIWLFFVSCITLLASAFTAPDIRNHMKVFVYNRIVKNINNRG
jgi:O-antigen/teichoic acid export membrane protein